MTYLLAVIGSDVSQSLSPPIYNAVFAAMAIDARYEAWSLPSSDLPAVIERLRGEEMLGLSVTVPHKQAVIPLLDGLDATAARIGAVNCIAKEGGRLIGHNTDRYGFLRALREGGCEPKGLHVLVLGYGGSARAITHGLIEADAASLAIAGPRDGRFALARELRPVAGDTAITTEGWFDGEEVDAGLRAAAAKAELIVNCTPLGHQGKEGEGKSPLPRSLLRPGVFVFDAVYLPLETPFLAGARAAGARPIAAGGLAMLVYQAEEAVRLWTGRVPNVDIMREGALKALGLPATPESP